MTLRRKAQQVLIQTANEDKSFEMMSPHQFKSNVKLKKVETFQTISDGDDFFRVKCSNGLAKALIP